MLSLFLANSINLFSQIDMVKHGYFYTIFDHESKAASFISDKYVAYSDCVSALHLHLLGDEIRRSPVPELIVDLKNFNVIDINYKARKMLLAPVDWEPFKIFPKNKENQILNKIVLNEKTSEFCTIQRYNNEIFNTYYCLKTITATDRLFLRLSLGCPVLSLQDTEKLLS